MDGRTLSHVIQAVPHYGLQTDKQSCQKNDHVVERGRGLSAARGRLLLRYAVVVAVGDNQTATQPTTQQNKEIQSSSSPFASRVQSCSRCSATTLLVTSIASIELSSDLFEHYLAYKYSIKDHQKVLSIATSPTILPKTEPPGILEFSRREAPVF
jgi:hypothetical protein